jgi:hypothetical protein
MPTGACGINCEVCKLNLLTICSTCGPGKSREAEKKIAAQERILGSPCPILACAFDRRVDYCSRDCDQFPCDHFKAGPYPFSQAYLNMQERRRRERPKAKIPCGDTVKVPPQYWADLGQRDMALLCKNALATVYPPDKIILPFLGHDLLVDRTGRRLCSLNHGRWDIIEAPLLETLSLVYLLNVGPEPPSHHMVSAHDLRDAQFFRGPHELKVLPLLERYGGDLDGFKRAAERLSGEAVELADVAYRVLAFPKVPIFYLFWHGDEEFEPRLSILFDRSIEGFLSADAIWGLTNMVSDILIMGDQWSLR